MNFHKPSPPPGHTTAPAGFTPGPLPAPTGAYPGQMKTVDGASVQCIDVVFNVPIWIYEPPVNTPSGSKVYPIAPLPSGQLVANDNLKSQIHRYWGQTYRVGDVTK